MGFWDSLKGAIFLDDDDEDDDELYEKEVGGMYKNDAKNSKNNKFNRSSSVKKESSSPAKSYSSSSKSTGDSSAKTPGQLAQEKRRNNPSASSSSALSDRSSSYSSSTGVPPRSPESTYSEIYKPKPQRRTQDASDIRIFKAKTFSDAQTVCDNLTSGKAIIVSFEETDFSETQRIMDFVCGSIYVLEGNIHTISEKIFLFSPKDVDVSGDYMSMVARNGFGVPTFNK